MTLSESLGTFVGSRSGKAKPYKRRERRAWPIHGFVGPNGSGKSVCMVWDTLPTLEAGRRVLSTVRLLDYSNPRDCEGCEVAEYHQSGDGSRCLECASGNTVEAAPDGEILCASCGHVFTPRRHRQAHPLWVPFTDWQQLLDAERCDVLMDEVTGVASSRESHSMPAPVANTLVQLRRRDVVVRWSAPSWARADKIIRECSQAVTHSNGYWPVAATDTGADRAWRNRRLFKWSTYDANDFEEFTVGKREQLSPIVRDKFWGPGSVVFDAYDTLDSVLSIGTVTDSGRCYRCGGRRRVPECSCEPRRPGRGAGEAGSPAGGAVPAPAPGRRVLADISVPS